MTKLISYRGTTHVPDTDEARRVLDWVAVTTGRAPRVYDKVYELLFYGPTETDEAATEGDE